MSDLHLPPPAEPEIPKFLQFPRDLSVNGDMTPAQWMVTHSPGFVWLWIRQPLNVYAQNFGADGARAMAAKLSEAADRADATIVEARTPLFGPNGNVIK